MADHCQHCAADDAGRRFAEEQLGEVLGALNEIGLTWLFSPDPAQVGRLVPTAQLTDDEINRGNDDELIAAFRARLGLTTPGAGE